MNNDLTMDATILMANLSDKREDSQGAGPMEQEVFPQNASDFGLRSDIGSKDLTKEAVPYWVLVYPQGISAHADDDPSDQSSPYWALVYPENVSSHADDNQSLTYWALLYPRHSSLHADDDQCAAQWALVYPRYVAWHADDNQSDRSLEKGTVADTSVPMCDLNDELMDQTDHMIKQSREVVLMGNTVESQNFGPDNIQSHSHSKHGYSDLQSSDRGGFGSPLYSTEGNAWDVPSNADDEQCDKSPAIGNTIVPICNPKGLLLDPTDH